VAKVSVILSAYNAEKYLAIAVKSILDQTFGDFELFLINDASTDGTGDIIRSFSDTRIIHINNGINLGVAVSANKCMDAANGEYIARMDADDISLPHRFERQVKFMDENPDIGICGSWIDTIGPYNNYTNKYPADHAEIKYRMLYENFFCQPVIMLRKKFFDKFNLRYVPSFFPT
jgi:glycosyltransferase involved in cell wall biosynthesis